MPATGYEKSAESFRVGARIHCSLYGGKDGTIYRIHGEPGQGNYKMLRGSVGALVTGPECSIDVVWDKGGMSRSVSESIVMGPQWHFLVEERDLNQIEIAQALANAESYRKNREAEAEAMKQAFEKDVAELRNDSAYQHMAQTPANGDPVDVTKLVAQNIRRHLKIKFPSISFSVRKEDYSSVNVTWPQSHEGEKENVLDALSIFQVQHYSHTPFNTVFGGVQDISGACRQD